MALSAQNQNLISEIMIKGEQILALQNELDLIVLRFNENNVFNEATDQELAAVTSLNHLTQSNVGNAIAAYIALVGTLNTNAAAHRIALAKLKG